MKVVFVDEANSTAITYNNPQACYNINSLIANLETFKYCLQLNIVDPVVTFKFVGVSVDYSSPLLPAANSSAMVISVDGDTPEPVQVFPQTSPSLPPNAKWSRSGLGNGTHTVQISLGSVGLGDLEAVCIDTFRYTILEPGDNYTPSSSLAVSTSTAVTSIVSSASSSSAASSQPSKSTAEQEAPLNHVLAIVLGTVLGLLTLVFVSVGFLVYKRKRARQAVPDHASPHGSTPTTMQQVPDSHGRLAVRPYNYDGEKSGAALANLTVGIPGSAQPHASTSSEPLLGGQNSNGNLPVTPYTLTSPTASGSSDTASPFPPASVSKLPRHEDSNSPASSDSTFAAPPAAATNKSSQLISASAVAEVDDMAEPPPQYSLTVEGDNTRS